MREQKSWSARVIRLLLVAFSNWPSSPPPRPCNSLPVVVEIGAQKSAQARVLPEKRLQATCLFCAVQRDRTQLATRPAHCGDNVLFFPGVNYGCVTQNLSSELFENGFMRVGVSSLRSRPSVEAPVWMLIKLQSEAVWFPQQAMLSMN